MKRRDFLKLTSAAVASAAVPDLAAAAAAPSGIDLGGRRYWPLQNFNSLWLVQGHENLKLDLRSIDHYRAACWMLRDRRENQYRAASLWLLHSAALIQAIVTHLYGHVPLHIHSGFRTHKTNHVVGGATRSMHLEDARGMFYAMDIHVPHLDADRLGQIALFARQGGVGIYRRKGFVHIDVGRPRSWIK